MQLALHTKAGHGSAQSRWDLYPESRHTTLGDRCMQCAGEPLSFRLKTWDVNIQSFHVLCSCGSLPLDQTPGKSLRSLRLGFRASDSSAESVDVAHSFGTGCLSANPCQRLQGFASLPAELLMSCSSIRLCQKAQVSKAQPFKVFELSQFHFDGDGPQRNHACSSTGASLEYECLAGEQLQPEEGMNCVFIELWFCCGEKGVL